MIMQKRKYAFRYLCLILSLGILCSLFSVFAEESADNTTGADSSAGLEEKGLYSDTVSMLGGMNRVAAMDGLERYFNKITLDVAVRDTDSGEIWTSSPYDYNRDAIASNETKASLASFITLTYYDTQSREFSMNGYEDCVAKGQFEHENIENGISVKMQIGETQDQFNVPFAAEADRFEEKVINQLSGIARRRIEGFYTRYSADDENLDPEVKSRLLEQYPGLADYDLYILRDDVSDRDISVLNGYISETDYTAEDYRDDIEKSGSTNQGEASALFEITVEFYLENGSLVVNVPADKISYDKSSFVLNRIRMMEYFGAGRSENDGYLFVPDGSGSLIYFNTDSEKSILNTVNRVYGQDYTLLQNNEYQNLSQQTYLPVFGIKEEQRAVFGIIEDGDAMAQIISQSGNIISGYETVSADFVYATVQSYLYDDGTKQNGQWTYMDRNYYEGDYRIRYMFITGESAGYVGMAQAYRTYLVDRGELKKLSEDTKFPLYLETIGLITRADSFFGIPYNRKIAITSFSDAIDMMNELKQNGVEYIKLRYKGWANGGLNNTVPSGVSIEKKLGGADGFNELADYIEKNGFVIYPDVNFNIIRNNKLFDSFISLFDSPRSNDDNIVSLTPPEEINNISDEQNLYAAVRPSKTADYYSGFFGDYEKYGVKSVSITYAGNMLYSDFDKDNGVTRQQALDILENNLAENESAIGKLLTDGGNAYIFKHSDDILNVPLSCSESIVQDESVPFIQIVLHGYIQYAGSPVNLSDNLETSVLKSAEYGAALYFSLGYENTDSLKDTPLSYMYSIDYETWKSDIISLYDKYSSVFSELQDKEITDHEQLAEDVYRTTYEGGTSVVVNYGESAYTVNGTVVEPQDFSGV